MKPVVKGLLIGCVLLIFAGLVVILGAVWFFQKNKGRIKAEAERVQTDAREFAQNATTSQCVANAIDRYRNDESILGETRARVWLSECLDNATPDPNLCTQVPRNDEIMRTVRWRLAECARLGLDNDKGCTRILTEVQNYCEK